MNTINQSQNSQSALEELAAQRHIYSEAKCILSIRGVLALAIAVVFPILGGSYPGTVSFFAVIAIAYFALDILFLKAAESNKKTLAAKVQEQFDTSVLGIRWNPVVVEEKPERGDIQEHAKKIDSKGIQELRDWYNSAVSQLPLNVAKPVCQRANVWWDSKLRRRYANCLLVISILLAAGLYFFVKDKAVSDALIALAPFAPILKLLVEQFDSHRKSADRLDAIKTHLTSTLNDILANPSGVIEESATRAVQDEIYRHRSSATPIPDFFYRLFKKKYEAQMGFNTDDFVKDYNSALAVTNTTLP